MVVGSSPAIVIQTSQTNVTCFSGSDGAIDATVSGGNLPFSYSWSDGSSVIASSQDLTGLPIGTYTLTLTDGNFCQQSSSAVTLTQPPALTASAAAATSSVCSGSTATFTLTSTLGNVVTYKINNGSNQTATIGSGGTVNVVVNNATTTQTLTLQYVSDGTCSNAVSGSAVVTILALPNANAGLDQTACS